MALAERMLAARFNTEAFPLFNHFTYVIASDGDLMEGVASETASLAGHLGLGSLIVLYDDNGITIEGKTDLAFSEDVAARYAGYGWHVESVDGHNRPAIGRAVESAQKERDRPSIIICKTHIAYGAPTKQDTASAHGEPLGDDEIRQVKEKYGFPPDVSFHIPPDVTKFCDNVGRKGEAIYGKWEALRESYREKEPEKSAELDRYLAGGVPEDLASVLPAFEAGQAVATRASSGTVINALAPAVPNLVGGSADLAPSTKTLFKDSKDVASGAFGGRNFRFGIREHGMGSILNGLALHGGLIPFGATFLVFSDYMRPPIRLAALMGIRTIYVFTHDSIFVGEDGPTHQPVEQVAALRSIPNLDVVRPAEATEVAYAWLHALTRTEGPTALCLSRQGVPTFDRTVLAPADGVLRGAYVLSDDAGTPDWVLIGTGSEVHVCLEAAELLREEGARIRVVSMPCCEAFLRQDEAYRHSVLPAGSRRAVVEAGVRMGWDRFVGPDGVYLTQDRFGASAPYKILAEKFGFTAKNLVRLLNEA
jgi:transketolase